MAERTLAVRHVPTCASAVTGRGGRAIGLHIRSKYTEFPIGKCFAHKRVSKITGRRETAGGRPEGLGERYTEMGSG